MREDNGEEKPSDAFYPEEKLFRAVPDGHPVMFDKNHRVTSAIFQDSKGVSVDRAWHRDPKEAVEALCNRLSRLQGKTPEAYRVVSVTKKDCDSVEASCLYDPLPDDDYHSLILRQSDIPKLTKSQARALVQCAHVEC